MRPASVSQLNAARLVATVFRVIAGVVVIAGIPLLLVTPLVLIIGLAVFAFTFVIPLAAAAIVRKREGPLELRQSGAPGIATVLQATQTNESFGSAGARAGGAFVWRVRLHVEAEGIPTYEIETRLVPEVGSSGLRPGTKWPVFVDRKKRDKILVDWEKLQASGHRAEPRPGLVITSQALLDDLQK